MGSDFMKFHSASVHYRPLTLTLDRHTVPMIRYRRVNPIVALCTSRRVLLSLGEECVLQAKARGPVNPHQDYYISAPSTSDDQEAPPLAVANTVSTCKEGKMMVRVTNLGYSKLALQKGDVIAECSPAKVISQVAAHERDNPEETPDATGSPLPTKPKQHRRKKTTNLRIRLAMTGPDP